ncbi:hypothetical protein ACFXGA_26340 [Actinosynnema sp. NPDC059335]|uniref:hypothetical protein n=1 Tax=Actinosynnema sp. NPDC059335 TaxID=3346804 RepID=UPI00366B4943
MSHRTGPTLRGILLAAAVTGGTLLAPAGPALAQDDISIQLTCEIRPNHLRTTRAEILARSQTWINEGVPYSQNNCYRNVHGEYRADCSGFVSMAWGVRYSYTTFILENVSHEIPRADLQPGDALNDWDSHVALFVRWADAAKTMPVVREQAGPDGSRTVERTWTAAQAAQYVPIRYDHLVEAAPPTDAADPMYHQIRNADTTWTGFQPMSGYDTDAPADAKDVAVATAPDGSAHTVIIGADDVVYHQIRNADTTWTGFQPLSGNGTTTPAKGKRVAVTAGPDGSAQVVIIGWDDKVYHQTRTPDGNWTGFQPVNGMDTTLPAAGKDVAIDTLPDGSAHLVIVGADDVAYHRVRTGVDWTPFRALAGNGTTTPAKAKRVAVTGMADGRVQVVIVGWDDKVYHQIRNADTTWTGFQPVNGMDTTTPAAGKDVAIDAHPDGSAQLLIVGGDDGIYHRVRNADTSWTGFRPVAGIGTTLAKGSQVSLSADDDGNAQIVVVGH